MSKTLKKGLDVREAKVSDFKGVKNIQREGYGKVTWGFFHMLINRLKGGSIYLIIDKEGNMLGYVEELVNKRKKTVHILNICFYPEYQGKGLGTKMLEQRDKDYKGKGLEKVTLHARESRKYVRSWYESLNFVEKKVIKWYYKNEDGIKYEKVIG